MVVQKLDDNIRGKGPAWKQQYVNTHKKPELREAHRDIILCFGDPFIR